MRQLGGNGPPALNSINSALVKGAPAPSARNAVMATVEPGFLPAANKVNRYLGIFVAAAIIAITELLVPANLHGVPDWLQLPWSAWTDSAMVYMASGVHIAGYTLQQVTRLLATGLDAVVRGLVVVLVEGLKTGSGLNKVQVFPPVSWLGLTCATALVAYRLGSFKLCALALATWLYIVAFGFYVPTMLTLANIIGAIAVAIAGGMLLGIWGARNDSVYAVLRSAMNVMQTVPIFSYLLPTLLFFGYGPSAALVATVIYAMPPMVHATVLALRSVPGEIIEYAQMAGCTRRQILWKVEIPAAVPRLAIGINQAVMMCFNMVILTSMIGVGGLGYVVLQALRRLDIGSGLQAGMAIVLLGVLLDRMTMAAAAKTSDTQPSDRMRDMLSLLGLLLATTALSLAVPALQEWPRTWTISSASFWNGLVTWVNVHLFDAIESVRTFWLLNILYPYRDFLAGRSFLIVLLCTTLLGAATGGRRVATFVCLMLLFIASSGFWAPAMNSVYLISVSVMVALVLGIPIGIVAAKQAWMRGPIGFSLDTLQTMPTLVYLLPAVMLFRNGDVSAIFAIASYSIAPVIRYMMEGLVRVPSERVEAGLMSGCTPFQRFVHVELPSATPALLLGLNQTIMMAFSMLIIAAMVGTKDLGQEVFMSLTRAQTGTGIVVGLCIAALALTADSILRSASAHFMDAERNKHGN